MSATRRELVAEQLRREIMDQVLAPGSLLSETGVARRLGVSPTPVREAFHELLCDGWLQVRDGHRRVTMLTAEESREFFELVSRLLALCLDKAADHTQPPPAEDIVAVVGRFIRALRIADYDAARQAQRNFVTALGDVSGHPLLARTVEDLAALSRAVDVHRVDATPQTWLQAMEHLVGPFQRADYRAAARIMNEDRDVFLADIDQHHARLTPRSPRLPQPASIGSEDAETITSTVTRRLRAEILAGELTPGTPLRERAIARSWKVSATPVREAIWQLAAEALLQPRPGGGQRVSQPSPDAAGRLLDLGASVMALTVCWFTERSPDATAGRRVADQLGRAAEEWAHDRFRAAAIERELTNRLASRIGNVGLMSLVRRSQLMATPAAVSLPPGTASSWADAGLRAAQSLIDGRTQEAVRILRTRALGLSLSCDSAPG